MARKQPLYPHVTPSMAKKTSSKQQHFSLYFDVTYSQASRSAGRRYLREKFSSYIREIKNFDPNARVETGSVIGTYDVYTMKDIIALFKGRKGGPEIRLLDY